MSRYKKLLERVKALEVQLNDDMYDQKIIDRRYWNPYEYYPTHTEKRPTYKAKLRAIMEHLGLEVSVEQEKHIEPELVVEKRKKKS